MKLDSYIVDDILILNIKGKIMGGPESTELLKKIDETLAAGYTKIVVNMTDVDWIDSTGLGILISLLISLKKRGGHLKLANISDLFRSLLTITKFISVFDLAESTEEAVMSLKKDFN